MELQLNKRPPHLFPGMGTARMAEKRLHWLVLFQPYLTLVLGNNLNPLWQIFNAFGQIFIVVNRQILNIYTSYLVTPTGKKASTRACLVRFHTHSLFLRISTYLLRNSVKPHHLSRTMSL